MMGRIDVQAMRSWELGSEGRQTDNDRVAVVRPEGTVYDISLEKDFGSLTPDCREWKVCD